MVSAVSSVTRIEPTQGATSNPGNASRLALLTRRLAAVEKQLAALSKDPTPSQSQSQQVTAIHAEMTALQGRIAQLQMPEIPGEETIKRNRPLDRAPVSGKPDHERVSSDTKHAGTSSLAPVSTMEATSSSAPNEFPSASADTLGQNVDEYV